MCLQSNSFLQNGKYGVIRVLGKGGFGITYEAEQVALHRRVAIKEFFMKDYCERDETTSHVTLGTSSGSKEIVEKFRNKFIREAQMIASLDHPHIVKIHDVFEENGTAYYVMEYLGGGSLAGLVKDSGPLSENQALDYVLQIGDALSYLHAQNYLHFDVKPSNILLNQVGKAVLIDFGISKHYDNGGGQTSSTPVGISKGYAPLEQYQQAELSTFTPATDVYALGATLFFLLTGQTPPSASEVNEDGLPPFPSIVSMPVQKAIIRAMSPRKKDRQQSVRLFLSQLESSVSSIDNGSEETVINDNNSVFRPIPVTNKESGIIDDSKEKKTTPFFKGRWLFLSIFAIAVITASLIIWGRSSDNRNTPMKPLETAPSTIKSNTTGSIKLISYPPGAAVYLDGQQTNRITPTEIGNVAPGYHTVVLKKSGFEDYAVSIEVSANKNVTTSCVLKDVSSFISTSSNKDSNAAIYSNAPNTENKEMGLSKDRLVLKAGESYTLSAYHYGSSVSWNTEDPKVATVSKKGKVTAVAPGRTLIWAQGSNKKVAGCIVEVSE